MISKGKEEGGRGRRGEGTSEGGMRTNEADPRSSRLIESDVSRAVPVIVPVAGDPTPTESAERLGVVVALWVPVSLQAKRKEGSASCERV
jgi:hypothetical protein